MKSKSIIRNIIIIVVVVAIGYVGYRYYFSTQASSAAAGSTGLQTTSSATGAVTNGTVATAAGQTDAGGDDSSTAIGQNFLSLLLSVKSIKLDDTILNSKAFTLLQDFNRPIPPDTDPGRPDPFAILGVDGAAVSTQVSTSNTSSITTTTSILNGTLAVGGPGITRWFEYGTTNALGTATTASQQANPGAFSETISGLQPNTTYYVKAAASIGGIVVGGNLVTWTTAQGGTQQTQTTPTKQIPINTVPATPSATQ